MHRAYATILRDTPPEASSAWPLMALACDSFEGNVRLLRQGKPPLACCHRGCATCCSLGVAATAPEALLMARLLRSLTPRLLERDIDLLGAVRAADQPTRGLGEQLRVRLPRACPFVARGVCVIYEARPLACRSHQWVRAIPAQEIADAFDRLRPWA